jgi:type IV pilus assembly protein PilM
LSKGLAEKITDVFGPQAPLWACELTSKHIIVTGVNRQRNSVRAKIAGELPAGAVATSYSESNIRDSELVRSRVRQLLSQAGFTGSEIAVVVPDDTARIALLAAENPSKNPEEQRAFIRWKLKKTVAFDVESAQIAYRILNRQKGNAGVDILVALSPRSIVEEYEKLFDSFDIHAGMVVPSTLAVLNLFNAPAGDSLYLKVAPDCVTTTVFRDRRIQFYRRVTDSSLYDAAYPTVMYYQDKLGGSGLQHLFVCGYDSDVGVSLTEIQQRLGLSPQRIEPMNMDDIFKPALGSVHLAWQNLI